MKLLRPAVPRKSRTVGFHWRLHVHRIPWLIPAASFAVSMVLMFGYNPYLALVFGLLGACMLVIGALV